MGFLDQIHQRMRRPQVSVGPATAVAPALPQAIGLTGLPAVMASPPVPPDMPFAVVAPATPENPVPVVTDTPMVPMGRPSYVVVRSQPPVTPGQSFGDTVGTAARFAKRRDVAKRAGYLNK